MGIIDRALEKQQGAITPPRPDPLPADVVKTVGASEVAVTEPAVASTRGQTPVAAEATADNGAPQFIIDFELLAAQGMLVPDDRRALIKEEYRYIKRKLLHNAFSPAGELAPKANLVMVTSANPHEGKSFTAINLALSIAHEQDRTVLLVDADVVKPSLGEHLGLPPQRGLVDYLLGEVDDIGALIVNTNLPRLKLILAGRQHHLTSELLASDRMSQLVAELGSRYPDRVVVFDCPPLLGVSESHSMAMLVGQTVFVVAHGQTSQNDVQAALELLNPEAAVGFVLNRVPSGRKRPYAYYGYYGKR
ncbi:MAG: AAA family ATPase [Gammaproteobacteria bacterium]|nr:AAA family ATPase [Gammaproteobacteria bacterium]